MHVEIFLLLWSMASLLWWLLAWGLVASDQRRRPRSLTTSAHRSLSVFKPLPPLGSEGIALMTPGLESFLAQLDDQSEMLLGLHDADRSVATPFLERMQQKYSRVRLKIIWRSTPDDVANPKIAWQKILAKVATGELWLWSDADIVAPPDFLDRAREDHARMGASLLTFPYVVRALPAAPALLEALFVNAEFYPGVLLLRQLGRVDFGLGAALLFERDRFFAHVGWHDIGSQLSDDFHLGQKLQPAYLGSSTLTTVATSSRWPDALAHDWRWAKTIWWNRPVGSAARVMTLPILGWLAYVFLHPLHLFAWAGLLGCMQVEVLFAAALCGRIGCPLGRQAFWHLPGWTLWRVLLWCLCWFPGSVNWSGKTWHGPEMTSPARLKPGSPGQNPLTSFSLKSIFLKTKGLKG